jgi:hypothetical protein
VICMLRYHQVCLSSFADCSCFGWPVLGPCAQLSFSEAGLHHAVQVTLIREAGAAPDHPLHPCYPEGAYLTNLTYRVQ